MKVSNVGNKLLISMRKGTLLSQNCFLVLRRFYQPTLQINWFKQANKNPTIVMIGYYTKIVFNLIIIMI